MTYSTCTINPGENEGMVRYALDTYPCLRLVPAEPRLGRRGGGGGGGGKEGEGGGWLTEEERGMVQVFVPGEGGREGWLDVSGFFVAKFEKVESVFGEEEGEEEEGVREEGMREGGRARTSK
jgi:16S rRNA C967 or C1407 C5-methylase (RsmB/RsmF family)